MLQVFLQEHIITAYIFLIIISLTVGSLLNVVIYRLPLMLEAEWKTQCNEFLKISSSANENKVNLFFPRSFCPSCQTTIPFWHNIPLLSYCILRGSCFKCHHKIPLRYPLVEALSLFLSLFAAIYFGFNLHLFFALIFIWLLIPLFFIDLQYQILPDSLIYMLIWSGLIANTFNLFTPLNNAVYSAVCAYLFLWFIMQLFYLVTGKVGMGHGDFKLFAAFGAWLGWLALPFILLLSSLIGAIIGIIYLKFTQQNRDTPIPFGPFLVVAGLVSFFYGNDIIHWYLKLF